MSIVIARLILSAHPTECLHVAVHNLDTNEQALIPAQHISLLIKDCAVWDVRRFAVGIPFETAMRLEDWSAWADIFPMISSSHLLLKATALEGGMISVKALGEAREAIIPETSVLLFIAECSIWDTANFWQKESIATWISCARWAAWLAAFEVCELSADAAASLSGAA